MNIENTKNIWIMRPGALGDSVLTLPFLRKVEQEFPDAKLTLWGTKPYLDIIGKFGNWVLKDFNSLEISVLFVDDIKEEDCAFELPELVFCVLKKDIIVKNNFDLLGVYNIWIEPRPTKKQHMAKHLCSSIQSDDQLGYYDFPLKLIKKDSCKIIMHLGTGSPFKLIKMSYWESYMQKLCLCLEEKKIVYTISVLVGPAEDVPLFSFENEKIRVLKSTKMDSLVKTLQSSDFYFGLDSGVSHVAGVLGLRGCAFFTKTDPLEWAPLGKGMKSFCGAEMMDAGFEYFKDVFLSKVCG